MSSRSVQTQVQALEALSNFTSRPGIGISIAREGGIRRLARLLNRTDVNVLAARVLSILSADATNHAAIVEAGCVDPLVQLLDSDSEAMQAYAAGTLGNLGTNTEYSDEIGSAGAIAPLVAMLESMVIEVQSAAVSTLSALSANADNAVSIAVAGGIAHLVRLLGSASKVVHGSAVCALVNMARCNDQLCIKIGSEGAIAPLVALLQSLSSGVQYCAALSLHILSANAENKAAIIAAGGVARLSALQQSTDKKKNLLVECKSFACACTCAARAFYEPTECHV